MLLARSKMVARKAAATEPAGQDRDLFLKELLDAGYVFGDIDANGVMFYFGDANPPAILQPTKLFELLDSFEFTLGKSWVFEQGLTLKDV